MEMVQVVLLTVLMFFVLVTVHEWGHYYFAKRAGILVREFGASVSVRNCFLINGMRHSSLCVYCLLAVMPGWLVKIRRLLKLAQDRPLR